MSRTQSDLNESFRKFDEAVGRRETPEAYETRMLTFKQAFGYLPGEVYDPLEQPFAKSVMNRLRQRWAVDRTATEDQVSGTAFSTKRRGELEAMSGGHYLAREYGMRTAMDENLSTQFKEQPGIRLDHPNSSQYLRDAPGKAELLFKELYESKKGKESWVDGMMFFVNSESAAKKLTQIYGKDVFPDGMDYTIEELAPGVKVLTLHTFLEPKKAEEVKEKLASLGGTPSSYEAFKAINGDGEPALGNPALLADESLDNTALVAETTGSDAVATLDDLPADHPMKSNAKAAANLVKGLGRTLEKLVGTDAFDRNKLVQNALQSLQNIVSAMPAYVDDTPRFTRLFDLMVDELYLVLSTCHPYGPEDYKKNAKKALETRAPVVKDMEATVTNHVFSSGMDAITSGITAALSAQEAEGVGSLDSPDYFEVPMLLKPGKLMSPEKGVIVATLNPSLPNTKTGEESDAWDVAKLEKTLREALDSATGPTTLVLDITVEKGMEDPADSELNKLLGAFKKDIEAGLLNVVMCKSYQKYPSLGTGKVMSGGVSVISANTDMQKKLQSALDDAETDLGFMNSDESQLMTHFIEHGSEQEVQMLKRASENARFAQDFCAPDGWGRYGKDLPFVHTSKLSTNLGGSKKGLPDLLAQMGLEQRDSFSFQNSSIVSIVGTNTPDDGIRINTGQESEAEIVEKLYAVGQLVLDRDDVQFTDVVGLAGRSVDGAFQEALANVEPSAWRPAIETALSADPGFLQQALKKYASRPVTELEDKELLAVLKLWESDEKNSGKALAAKLSATCSASGPVLDDNVLEQDSADLMHASIEWGWKGKSGPVKGSQSGSARHVESMVASCLKLATVGFETEGPEKEALDQMYESLMDTGMRRVSPETRQKLVEDWAKGAMKAPMDNLDKISRYLPLMPYREGAARLFDDGIPEDAFGELDPDDQRKLTATLLDKADLRTQLLLLEELVWSDKQKGRACAAHLDVALKRAESEEKVSTETLTSSKAPASAVPTMSPDELATLRDWYTELVGILEERAVNDAVVLDPRKGFALRFDRGPQLNLLSSDLAARYGQGSMAEYIRLLQAQKAFADAVPSNEQWLSLKSDKKAAMRLCLKLRKLVSDVSSSASGLEEALDGYSSDEDLKALWVSPKPVLTRENLGKESTGLVNAAKMVSDRLTAT